MIYKRKLQEVIEKRLFKKEAIIIYGPRQVGKSTLVKEIVSKYKNISLYLNCELQEVKDLLKIGNVEIFKSKIGNKTLIILDEAQTVENIGSILKLIIDTYPEIQIIATGSSSFELANKINEPLTGRVFTYMLYPLSLSEILETDGAKIITEKRLEHLMRFGFYPDVVDLPEEEAYKKLQSLSQSYLYKDILTFEEIKKSSLLDNLLKLLAVSMGQEVSLTNLSKHLNVSKQTIERYISLLEKVFIIKILRPLSINKFHEIFNPFKVYFIDTGFRNIILQNTNLLQNRQDVGFLFENMFIMERFKKMEYEENFANTYFWRTYSQQEIDFIEDKNGVYNCFECKWNGGKDRHLKAFKEKYGNSTSQIITKQNLLDFI